MISPLTSFLAADHAAAIAYLERARADPAQLDLAAYEAFRAALLRHVALEDTVLLPALQQAAPPGLERLLRPTRIEHAALVSLLSLTPDEDLMDEIASLLQAHESAEEAPDGLYRLVDVHLAARADELIATMRALPVGTAARPSDRPGAPRTAQAALAAVLVRFSG